MEKKQLISTVTSAQNGDNNALNTLFNEYYNDLYYFALKTVKDEETALDVTQEAFVEIINTLSNLKEPAAFVTWAKQITYHQCTRYFKKKKDVLVDEDEDGNTVFDTLQEDNAEFIPDEALDKDDFKKTIMAILDELSEEQRSATMMYYFDEMSVHQIAEIQGVSEGTVKSRLNYARKAIKNSVEEYEKKNGIKLHALPFFPLFRWLFKGSFEGGMPLSSAKVIAKGIAASTGASVTVSTAVATTTVATTATAVGIGAKIAALPIATKIVAGIVAAAIAVGGTTTAVVLNNKDKNDTPADNQNIVSTEKEDVSQKEDKSDELVLEGVIPEGCTYTQYDGTVLTAGQNFPETCTAGDVVAYGDYLYGYECVYAKNSDNIDEWYLWKDNFDSGDSGLIESDAFECWSVMVANQTKSSYGVIASKINGKPIKTLYATFFGCKNMTEAPKIPSTITAMTAAYYDCISLEKAPKIPSNVQRIMLTFRGCTSLTGDVVINAKLDKSLEWYYSDTFSGTVNKINLTGSTPEEDLILIAKLSDNENITVNSKRVNYSDAPNGDGTVSNNDSDIQLDNPDGTIPGFQPDDLGGVTPEIQPTVPDAPITDPNDKPSTSQDFVVPSGCQYISVNGKTYNAGEKVDVQPATGDKFTTEDYIYTYNHRHSIKQVTNNGRIEFMDMTSEFNGWGVVVKDKTKTSYSELLSGIANQPLLSMDGTFEGCTNMVTAPKIPSSVHMMGGTFSNCKSLTASPTLPTGISSLFATFYACESLSPTLTIPNSVSSMRFTFCGCTSFVKTPFLPNSVTDIYGAFSDCFSLKTISNFPSNITNISAAFFRCTSLTTVPTIPKSVTELRQTFGFCESLTGTIQINATPTSSSGVSRCFMYTTLPITITGSCPFLNELAASAENGNVTVK